MTSTDDSRRAVIREICAREGHGSFADASAHGDPDDRAICKRGCGTLIFYTRRPRTVEELARYAEKHPGRAVTFMGAIEIGPEGTA